MHWRSIRPRMIRATALILLVQAASYHQASVPTQATQVLTTAAGSLEGLLGLDYDALEPMYKDITFMKERLVELMPYLEEAERPVIQKSYEYLLNLEGTLNVDLGRSSWPWCQKIRTILWWPPRLH